MMGEASQTSAAQIKPRWEGELALLQDIVPHYRIPVFARLARESGGLTIYAEHYDGEVPGAVCCRVRGFGGGTTRFHPRVISDAIRGRYRSIIVQGRVGLVTSLALVVIAPWIGLKVTWWSPFWRPSGQVRLGRGMHGALTRWVLRSVHSVVTYGSRASEVALAAGASESKVFTAYNSLDTRLLERAEREWKESPGRVERFLSEKGLVGYKVALFVGRMIPRKRIGELLQAMAQLVGAESRSDLKLIILGDGPEVQVMRSRAEALGLNNHVLFEKGIVEVDRICPYFLASRVVVLPGAGGLVINQALTHGIPVVVGGGDGTEADSVVEGRNGFYWHGDSPETLARAIATVTDLSDDEWQEWSRRAREAIASRTNIDRMIGGLVAAVER